MASGASSNSRAGSRVSEVRAKGRGWWRLMRPVTRSGGGGAQFAVALCTLAEEREERGRGAVLSAQRRLERVASMSKRNGLGISPRGGDWGSRADPDTITVKVNALSPLSTSDVHFFNFIGVLGGGFAR